MQRVVQTAQSGALRDVVQPMPPLSPEQLEALRDDIAQHGVLVPITVDQHGRIIDGNNRAAIAAELGIDCPRTQIDVADDDAAFDLAVTLNCARRHLNREQVRDLIRAEIARRPNDSDRAISRRVGCSPSTVGAVRKFEDGLSNLDTSTMSRVEAEARTEELQDTFRQIREPAFALMINALGYGITVPEVVMAWTQARMKFEAEYDGPDEGRTMFRIAVFDYLTTVVMWPETLESIGDIKSIAPEGRTILLDALVNIFAEPVLEAADLVGAE